MHGSQEASFGPWQAVQSLSRGPASEVLLARHGRDGSLAAVKAFLAAPEADHEAIRRSREIRLLAEVDHPRVVRILDSRTGAPWPERDYIVTEYVPGGDLAMLVRTAPLSFESTRVVGQAVAEALDCLHRMGIIHRDVKPANIFVPSASGQPEFAGTKLGDLGIAIEMDATRVTSNGLAVGTANYLSPEQVSGAPITPASDVYSLGLVLLECLSGTRAYGGAGLEAAIARLHRAPDIPAGVPRELRRLLRSMLATAPESRPSACDVASDLAAMRLSDGHCIAGEEPTRRYRHAAGGSHRAPAPRRRIALAAAALGAAAAVGGLGILWSGPDGGSTGAPPEPNVPASVVTQPAQQQAAAQEVAPVASASPAQPAEPVPTASDVAIVDPGSGGGAGGPTGDTGTSWTAPAPAPSVAVPPGKAAAPGQLKKQQK